MKESLNKFFSELLRLKVLFQVIGRKEKLSLSGWLGQRRGLLLRKNKWVNG